MAMLARNKSFGGRALQSIAACGVALMASFQLIIGPAPAYGAQAKTEPEEIALQIKAELDEALELYRSGQAKKARAKVSGAYFDIFEGKGLEASIAAVSASSKTELESMFGRVLGMMGSAASAAEIEAAIGKLNGRMAEAVKTLLKGSNPYTPFINSLVIITREGFEAILIISALAAYLVKTGNSGKVKFVYQGSILAILASIATAYLAHLLFSANPASQEVLEGATMLLATAVLFYVSFWLISKAESLKWQRFIQKKVEASISKGSIAALGFTAFLAVYREGAETILFYRALFSSAGGATSHIIWGFLVGLILLAAIFFAFRYGALLVPIRPFFAGTSILLYYLAFTFAGKGIVELQAGGVIGSRYLSSLPTIDFLGFYPTLQSLLAQGTLLMAALAGVIYLFIVPRRRWV